MINHRVELCYLESPDGNALVYVLVSIRTPFDKMSKCPKTC